MDLDFRRILERPGEAETVSADVDLSGVSFCGRRPFRTPVHATVQARNRAGAVSLDCTYSFTLSVRCDRCLRPFEKSVIRKVRHTLVRTLQNAERGDDYVVAENGIIAMRELAVSDLLPELPMRFLCRENCEGIGSGAAGSPDRDGTGRRKAADPRLTPLRRLLDEMKE